MAVQPPRTPLTLVSKADAGPDPMDAWPGAGTLPLGSAPPPSDWLYEPAEEHWVGDLAAAITTRIVDLVREHTGGGPTTAKATVSSELVVITIADCLTASDRQLVVTGNRELVLPTRDLLLRGMRADATAVVEALTQREVTAYLTDQQLDPDLAVIVFVLAPSPLNEA